MREGVEINELQSVDMGRCWMVYPRGKSRLKQNRRLEVGRAPRQKLTSLISPVSGRAARVYTRCLVQVSITTMGQPRPRSPPLWRSRRLPNRLTNLVRIPIHPRNPRQDQNSRIPVSSLPANPRNPTMTSDNSPCTSVHILPLAIVHSYHLFLISRVHLLRDLDEGGR